MVVEAPVLHRDDGRGQGGGEMVQTQRLPHQVAVGCDDMAGSVLSVRLGRRTASSADSGRGKSRQNHRIATAAGQAEPDAGDEAPAQQPAQHAAPARSDPCGRPGRGSMGSKRGRSGRGAASSGLIASRVAAAIAGRLAAARIVAQTCGGLVSGVSAMKGLFLDAVDDLAAVFHRVVRPTDPDDGRGGARRDQARGTGPG